MRKRSCRIGCPTRRLQPRRIAIAGIGDLRPGSGRAAGQHDWIHPAGPGFSWWELAWPIPAGHSAATRLRMMGAEISGIMAALEH